MSQTFEQNPHGGTNELIQGDGFYLSYQPNRNPMGLSVFRADTEEGETALCVPDGRPDGGTVWMILNGDFRREYEEAFAGGLPACVAVYESHRAERRSSWSSDGEMTEADALEWLRKRIESAVQS